MWMKPEMLEALNGVLAVLLVSVSTVFGIYILHEYRAHGFQRMRMSAALAIFASCFGSGINRGWVWWWRHLVNNGEPAQWMANHPVLQVSVLIQAVGLICLLRVFVPDRWKGRLWLVIGAVVVASLLPIVVATMDN